MKPDSVAYQGILGSYSNEAALQFFGENAVLVPKESFEDVFGAVTSGECAHGMVPVENSITGSVVQNYDLLDACRCFVTGEYILPVRHVLLGLSGADSAEIEQVYSHEQGFLQCARFLSAHKNWRQIPYFNTAVAAKYVSTEQDKRKAAIASEYAGEKYGLQVLAQNISDSPKNSTRFFAVSAKKADTTGNKASILFTLRHEKGSLAQALVHLSGLNLTRIESRPSPHTNWEYRFYVDIEGELAGFDTVLSGLNKYCTSVRLLGIYKSAR